jgi:ubiquinone/menaquinone biosynthesis C-methylase UbiE
MSLPRPTELAHQIVADTACSGDLLIDATTGNGTDTLLLARLAGSAGRVLAFDVQAEAIAAARERVEAAGMAQNVRFILESHATMSSHAAPGAAAVVMFNLGYLPGQDHAIVTTAAETLAALAAAATVLKPGGLLSVICYPGHSGGDGESKAVEDWMVRLPAAGWRVCRYGALGTLRPAPFLLAAVKP